MLIRERKAFILHQVNLHNKVMSADLSQHINVSDDTIRKDLQELAEKGKLIKVHGGALSSSFHNVQQPGNTVYLKEHKKVIARKAISLLHNDMFILTGGGTTIIEMTKQLPLELKATFISGNIPAVAEYKEHPNIDTIIIGDKVSKYSKITVGFEALSRIREINADVCFLSINALNLQDGISDNDWEIVQIKKAMIESAQKLVCLTISEN